MATAKIPQGLLDPNIGTNPAGKFHNGAETKWKPNPLDDPELVVRAGLDSLVERHNSDAFFVPEFMNNQNLAESKDYAVYDKNITGEQADEVDEAIGYQWSPELLGADLRLWLDASEASSVIVDGSSNVEGFLDKAVIPTILKTYDWSSGLDGVTPVQLTGTPGEFIGGEADWLKCTLIGGNVSHFLRQNGLYLTSIGMMKVTGKAYIPSTNIKVDGFRWNDHVTALTAFENQSLNTVIEFDTGWRAMRTTNGGNFRMYALDGSSITIDQNGDEIYFKDITFHFGTNSFWQDLTPNKGVYDGFSKITFDGIAGFLKSDKFQANQAADTQGEIFIVYRPLSNGTLLPFNLTDETTSVNTMGVGNLAGDDMILTHADGAGNNITSTNAKIAQDELVILAFSSTGSNYNFFKNTVEAAITGGTDDGNWIASISGLDNTGIGGFIDDVPAYYNVEVYSILYTNRQLTPNERGNLFNYLNKRFGAF